MRTFSLLPVYFIYLLVSVKCFSSNITPPPRYKFL